MLHCERLFPRLRSCGQNLSYSYRQCKMDCGVQQANLQFSERVCGLLQFRLHRGSHSVTPGLVFAILNTRRFGQYKTWTADYGLRTGYNIRTKYKTRTGKDGLGIKHGQGIKRGLRTADWVQNTDYGAN